jgi:hypothetical protein
MKLNINGNIVEIDNDAVAKALESEDGSLDIKPEGFIVRSQEQEDTYINNVKSEASTVSSEIARKELFRALEIDIEGTGAHKSIDKSVDAFKSYTEGVTKKAIEESGAEPNKKIESLNSDMESLRASLAAKEKEVSTVMDQFNSYKKDQTINSFLSNNMPDNLILPKEDMLTIMSAKVSLDVDDNGNLFGKDLNGNAIKDDLMNVMPAKSVLSNFFDNNPQYMKTASGGAGGGDSTGGGGKLSWDAFTKSMADKGLSPASAEFMAEAQALKEAGKLEI